MDYVYVYRFSGAVNTNHNFIWKACLRLKFYHQMIFEDQHQEFYYLLPMRKSPLGCFPSVNFVNSRSLDCILLVLSTTLFIKLIKLLYFNSVEAKKRTNWGNFKQSSVRLCMPDGSVLKPSSTQSHEDKNWGIESM